MHLPSLVRFMIRHALAGAALGAGVGLGLLLADAWGLATLARQASFGLAAWVLLPWGFAVTFGGVQIGIAVMLIDGDDAPHGGKRQRPPTAALAPVTTVPRTQRSPRHMATMG